MKSKTTLALVVGTMIGVSPGLANATYMTYSFQQGVDGYFDTHDTELREKYPSKNYHDNDTMTIDGDDNSGDIDDVDAVLRFGNIFGLGSGQIAYGSIIDSATLRLYVDNPGDDLIMLLKLQGWDEEYTEWGDFGSNGIQVADGEASYLRMLEGISNKGFIEIDVTSEMQLWSDDNPENFGWAFKPTDDNGVDIATSENSMVDWRPLLTVEAHLAQITSGPSQGPSIDSSNDIGEPASLAVFGLGLAGLGLYRRRRSA